MKKHFLLLVMAFMSIMAWAQAPTVVTNPEASFGLAYDGTEQALLYEEGAASGTAVLKYLVTSSTASTPTFDADTWLAAADVKATHAGAYKVWYVAYDATGEAGSQTSDIASLDVSIGKRAATVTPKADPVTYSGTTFGVAAFYTATGAVGGDVVCTVGGAGASAIAVGTYAFTLSGNPDYEITYYGGTPGGTLTIIKKDLSVAANAIEIPYGGTPVYTYTWDGLVENDQQTADPVTPKTSAVTISEPTVKNGEVVYAGAVGTYTITPNVTAANYNVTTTNGTLTVTGKSLASTDIVLTAPAGGTYKGTEFTFDPIVTDGGVAVASSQFTATYDYSANGTDWPETYTATPTAAGYYKQKIVPSGTSNYSGAKVSAAFQIGKADLLVTVKDKEVFYTGTALAYTAADVEYDGFVNAETSTVLGGTLAVANTNVNVGEYKVQASGLTAANYNLVYVKGNLKINPAKLKVIVKAQTATYGTEAASVTSWEGQDYFSNQAAAAKQVATYISLKRQNGATTYEDVTANADIIAALATTDFTVGETGYKYITGLKLTREAGTGFGTYTITASGASPASTNYTIESYETNTFTIGKGAITFDVDNQTKVYGGTDPELTYTVNGTDDATEIANIKAKVTIARVAGESAGSYNINLTVADKESFTNYTITEPATPAKFIITKAPLTITAQNQLLYVGDTEENLDKTATAVKFEGLKNSDEIAVDFAFSGGVAVDGDGKLTLDVTENTKDYAEGVVVTLAAGDANAEKAKNYNITWVNGKLSVIKAAAVLYLDDTVDDLSTAIEAADGQDRIVKFSPRTLKAGQWNTLVLPFATTVADLSTILTYAVVDMLAPSTDPETINLKLAFGEIPANTPFLVQPSANIDLSNVDFGTQTIEYSEDPSANDGQGHYFIGTYQTGKSVTSADKTEYYYSSSQKQFVNASGSTNIGIMRAYLKDRSGSNARMINIEEPDGTFTSISTINAEANEGNEGIYNLQGVRVNKAGKGVFIKNGKKFIK